MKKKAAAVFASSAIQKVSMLLLTIIAVRLIGAKEFGKFALVYAVCINSSGFLSDALAATANRYVPLSLTAPGNSAREIASMVMAITTFLALTLCLLIFFSAPVISNLTANGEDLDDLFRFAGITILFMMPATVSNALLHSLDKTYISSITTITTSVIIFAVSILGAIGDGARGMCIGLAVGSLVAAASYFYFLNRQFSVPLFVWRDFKKFIRSKIITEFTVPTVATMALGGPIHLLCVSFLASSENGLRNVAIFSAFFYWYSVLTFVPAALTNFTIPWLANVNDANKAPGGFKRKVIAILSFNFFIAAIIFIAIWLAQAQVLNLYGADFRREGNVFLLLAACGFIASIVTAMSQVLWAAGKTWNNLFASFIYGFSYICGAIIFIKVLNLGAAGLGFAIFVASIIQIAIQARFAIKHIRYL